MRLLFGGIETSPSVSQLLTQCRALCSWDFSQWTKVGKKGVKLEWHQTVKRNNIKYIFLERCSQTFSQFSHYIEFLTL